MLKWAWKTERWGSPFGAIGWMNWPAGVVDKMGTMLAVYNAFKGYSSAKNLAAWSNANVGQFTLVTQIEKSRRELESEGSD